MQTVMEDILDMEQDGDIGTGMIDSFGRVIDGEYANYTYWS